MEKIKENCILNDPSQNFLNLLSTPLKLNTSKRNLYTEWRHLFLDLYNNRTEFLLLGSTKVNGEKTIEYDILKTDFATNYKNMREGFEFIKQNKRRNSINHKILDMDNNFNTDKYQYKENENENENEIDISIKKDYAIFRLVVCIFQYLQYFDDKSINVNLWNYSLKSMNFSIRVCIIGIFTVICQYLWIGTLSYNLIDEYTINDDSDILIITVISTIITFLYSIDSFFSFYNSIFQYRFIMTLYNDYPDLILTSDQKKLIFYKNRDITINKTKLYINFICDFLSNFILPVLMPFLNIFIILSSGDVKEAIFNSMVILFIIHIDEDLFFLSDYEQDKDCRNFVRWIISNIYCDTYPEFIDVFKFECDSWHNSIFKAIAKVKNNKKNKICNEIVINFK